MQKRRRAMQDEGTCLAAGSRPARYDPQRREVTMNPRKISILSGQAVLNETQAKRDTPAIACRRCGSLGPHRQAPGRGPHHAELVCGDCAAFLQWLSAYSPAERAARRERYRQAAMAQQPVTQKQRNFLQSLGYSGQEPANRLTAHDLIDALLKQGEG